MYRRLWMVTAVLVAISPLYALRAVPSVRLLLDRMGLRSIVKHDTPIVSVSGDSGSNTRAHAIYQYLLAQEYLARDQASLGLKALKSIQGERPESAHLLVELAKVHIKQGEVEKGVAALRLALDKEPKLREARILLAGLYSTAKKHTQAQALYLDLLKDNSEDQEARLYLAVSEIESEKLGAALVRFKTLLDTDPENAVAQYYQGRVLEEIGQVEAAELAYSRALEVRPGFTQAGVRLGVLFEKAQKWDQAIKIYEQLALQTDSPMFYELLGNLYLDQKRYAEALLPLENALQQSPADKELRVRLALVHLELKNFMIARTHLSELRKRFPDDDMIVYFYLMTYDRAEWMAPKVRERLFTDALSVRTSSKYFENVVELLVNRVGLVDPSAELLTRCQQIRLFVPKDYVGRAQVLSELATLVFRKVSKERALAWMQEEPETVRSQIEFRYQMALLMWKMGDEDKALAQMENIVSVSADHAGALNFVGYTWANRGIRLSEAEQYILKALKKMPKDPAILDSLGWVYFKQGNIGRAREIFVSLVTYSRDPVVYYHAAHVFWKSGPPTDQYAYGYFLQAVLTGLDDRHERADAQTAMERLRQLGLAPKSGSAGAALLTRYLQRAYAPSGLPSGVRQPASEISNVQPYIVEP